MEIVTGSNIMAKIKGAVTVDMDRCKGCAVCVVACPFDVLALAREVNAKGYPYASTAHPDACTGCANCAVVCPDSCITVYRMKAEG
jgi:2-oxoglutarate ferredoxin oxidoreductase subunit delta